MKRLVLVIGLLAMVTVYAQAQEDSTHVYKSIFGQDSTQWNEMCLNDLWSHITHIFRAYHAFDSVGDDGATYCSIELDSNNWYIMHFSYMRLVETEKHDKVYLQFQWKKDSSKHEVLVMDLNLQEGDTFLITKVKRLETQEELDTIPVVVDSVYYVDSVKHIRFDSLWRFSTEPYNYKEYYRSRMVPFEFIEGLGTSFGCFYDCFWSSTFDENGYILFDILQCCFHDGDHVFWCDWLPYNFYQDNGTVQYPCFVDYRMPYGDVSETGKEYFSLYPNPHDGSTSLYNPEGRFIKLEVYDMSGRRMYATESSETSIPIEMAGRPAGVYLIRIEENGQVSYLKSVKQ